MDPDLLKRLDRAENIQSIRHESNITRLARLESTLAEFGRRLFGNGQPGIIEQLNKRLSKVEKVMYALFGAAGLIELVKTFREWMVTK